MADLIKLDADLDIIQKLDDEPNDVGGLSSAELKAEFDKAGNAIKTYLNDTLIPGIEGSGGEGGLVGEQIAAHNVAPDAHADIRQKITDDIGTHNVSPDAHTDIRQEIADNKAATDSDIKANASAIESVDQMAEAHIASRGNPHRVSFLQVGADQAGAAHAVQINLTTHEGRRDNPHGVTAKQTGADPIGTVVVADCYDEAASPTSAPNTWYVSRDTPKPSGEAGMTIDVRWKNGHAGGLGYSVKVVWGAPDDPGNETILSGLSVTGGLTGEVSIPVEGTIRYQLINRSDRLSLKYVSGPVVSRQFSSATAAAVADKQVPGLSLSYLPGMEIYVQLDAGNTADTMRLIPDEGPTLPVYGNGLGAKTGEIPSGYILHLKNAGDHWQIINQYSASSGGGGYVAQPDAPSDTSLLWVDTDDNTGAPTVDSVNGKTGAVTLSAADVGAASTADLRKLSEEKVKPSQLCNPLDVTGPVASCWPVGEYPFDGVISHIEPKQAGSGDPSPSNPRAISGWTGAKLTRSNGEKSDDFTVQFGQTVYGGSYDWSKGEMTIDQRILYLTGEELWEVQTLDNKQDIRYKLVIKNDYVFPETTKTLTPGLVCSRYKPSTGSNLWFSEEENGIACEAKAPILYVYDKVLSRETTPAKFKAQLAAWDAAGSPLQFTLKLKPNFQKVIKLTPQEILSLTGRNTLTSDTGDTTVKGWKSPAHEIEELKNAVLSAGGNV